MDQQYRRRLFVCIPVLILGALPQACVMFPTFSPEAVSVPVDQIDQPAAELNRGPLAAAINAVRMQR